MLLNAKRKPDMYERTVTNLDKLTFFMAQGFIQSGLVGAHYINTSPQVLGPKMAAGP